MKFEDVGQVPNKYFAAVFTKEKGIEDSNI